MRPVSLVTSVIALAAACRGTPSGRAHRPRDQAALTAVALDDNRSAKERVSALGELQTYTFKVGLNL